MYKSSVRSPYALHLARHPAERPFEPVACSIARSTRLARRRSDAVCASRPCKKTSAPRGDRAGNRALSPRRRRADQAARPSGIARATGSGLADEHVDAAPLFEGLVLVTRRTKRPRARHTGQRVLAGSRAIHTIARGGVAQGGGEHGALFTAATAPRGAGRVASLRRLLTWTCARPSRARPRARGRAARDARRRWGAGGCRRWCGAPARA